MLREKKEVFLQVTLCDATFYILQHNVSLFHDTALQLNFVLANFRFVINPVKV